MTLLATIALFGWIPFVVALCALVPARLAATVAVIGSWLLLPPYAISISGLPDYSKNLAASFGLLLGTLIFQTDRLLRFRPRMYDLPMLLFCFSGVPSALTNGQTLYDGLSDSLLQVLMWGLPYFFGRLYFSGPEGLRYFCAGIIGGGLSYILPCLFEMRMSPQLLGRLYGFSTWQGVRLGGYRPNVFFYTGLELGLWMTSSSLAAWWLWRCGAVKRIGRIQYGTFLMLSLLGTTILCRSTGALILLILGITTLWLSVKLRSRLVLASLVLVGVVYVSVRSTNVWSGNDAVSVAELFLKGERSESLAFRFRCENLLAAKAMEKPLFGWGGWGRNRVYFDTNEKLLVPMDGMWILILGSKGYFGLSLFYFALLLPAIQFVWRIPVRLWSHPAVAACPLVAVMLGLYMIDCLVNAFPNIIYVTLGGGLMGVDLKQVLAVASVRYSRAGGRSGVVRSVAVESPRGISSGLSPRNLGLAERTYGLGRSLRADGRLEEAETVWRHALQLLDTMIRDEPEHPDIKRRWCDCANDLAWLKLNHPDPAHRDPSTAMTLAHRAAEICPDCAGYWNTLGAAYFRAGEFDSAIVSLDHSTALDGVGSAFNDAFLAMAHARLGHQEQARHCLAHAISRAEQDYPGHVELVRLCNEAQSILADLDKFELSGESRA